MVSDKSLTSRRAVLAMGTACLTSVVSGCTGGVIQITSRDGVSLLSAGSLSLSLREGLASSVDVPLQIESHGSVTAARMIARGQRDPDIVALADPTLFRSILDASWHVAFASNALVVAYNPQTESGQRVATAAHWFEPIRNGAATLGRTDPNLDPLGYRTLFMLDLASQYYDQPNLVEEILSDGQLYPETELLSHFETGALDAAIVYRNMAVEREYEFIELPDRIDLSAPEYTDDYATTMHTLADGRTITGDIIEYGATIRGNTDDEATRTVFDTLLRGDYLAEYGFLTDSDFPTYSGNVPNTLTQ